MSKPQVLIIVCGAVGLLQSFYLDTQPIITAKLEAIYNLNGKLKVQRMPAFVGP